MKQILIIALTIALTASIAPAQSDLGSNFIPADYYTGVESSSGTCQTIEMLCYGNTFILNGTSKDETRHLTVSLNYFSYLPGSEKSFAVKSGTWSLVVMCAGQYAGTIYGEVTDGSIIFPVLENESDKKLILANLRATGGLGDFENYRRRKISGLLNLAASQSSRQSAGHLILEF